MKVYLQISPSGTLLGIHKSNYVNAKVAIAGQEVVEVELDKSLDAVGFEELKAKYAWHRDRKQLTKSP